MVAQNRITKELRELPFPTQQGADFGVINTDRILLGHNQMNVLHLRRGHRRAIFERPELNQKQDPDILDQSDRKDIGRKVIRQFARDLGTGHTVADRLLPEFCVIERTT
jgi:hypothetical protein